MIGSDPINKPFTLAPGFSFGGPLSPFLPDIEFPKLQGDAFWMQEALKVSLQGIGITSPNPSVGCVIVHESGKVITQGFTQAYPGLHAERFAFQNIQDWESLKKATAYVTLEPCSHFGKQPPCADLLVNSPIRRIVIARGDPFHQVNGEGIARLVQAKKEIAIGLLSAEVTAWNFGFFAYQALQRPVVLLKWAQTLDGQLADDTGYSKWISGPSSRAYAHWLRQKSDAILVGAGTFLKDSPQLDVRDCPLPRQAHPLPIVLDLQGKCLEFEGAPFPNRPWIWITSTVHLKKLTHSRLAQKKNMTPICLETHDLSQSESVESLLQALQGDVVRTLLGHPLQTLMVEGGPKTLSAFLKSGYADAIHLFIAPLLTGGKSHRIELLKTLPESLKYRLISTNQFGTDTLMEMVSENLSLKLFDFASLKSH